MFSNLHFKFIFIILVSLNFTSKHIKIMLLMIITPQFTGSPLKNYCQRTSLKTIFRTIPHYLIS